MKLKRISPGHYTSLDCRVEIRRLTSRQVYRADETCWTVTIDGKPLFPDCDTKREAVELAKRKLKQDQ